MFSAMLKIGGQGFLAASSFLVSFAAAHSLDASGLAVFFFAWTLESMWIAALRKVIMPSILTSRLRPSALSMWFVTLSSSVPVGGCVFLVGFVGGLGIGPSLMIGLTPLSLGCYDISRTYMSFGTKSFLPFIDLTMFTVSICAATFVYFFFELSLLETALVALTFVSFVLSAFVCFFVSRTILKDEVVGVWSWGVSASGQIGTGFLEWIVFFSVSMLGVFLLGFVGGAEVLAGVRLAETLVAPLSIAVSAIPLMLTPELDEIRRDRSRWPLLAQKICLLLTCGVVAWILVLLFIPDGMLGVLVGEHVHLAKAALLGVAIGVFVSPASTMLTFIMRVDGALKEIRVVRYVQLILSGPVVGVASLSRDPFVAALGLSAHQVLACVMLLAYDSRRRKRVSRSEEQHSVSR